MEIFGGQDPGGVVYLKTDFVKQNPVTVQKLTNAFYKALKWLPPRSRSPTLCQKSICSTIRRFISAAVRNSKPIYSVDDVIPKSGMSNSLNILVGFSPEMKGVNIDLAKTFDGRFVKRAAETIK